VKHSRGMPIDTSWFKVRLKALKKTQEDLATAAGISRTAMNKILSGRNRMQPIYTPGIATLLNSTVTEVMERAGILPAAEIQAHSQPGSPDAALGGAPETKRSDEDSEMLILALDIIEFLSGMDSLPKMPPGALAQLAKAEARALLAEDADEDQRLRLRNHAFKFLHLYLQMANPE
jgi:transcriptional regulator with XRE-family HTH domain